MEVEGARGARALQRGKQGRKWKGKMAVGWERGTEGGEGREDMNPMHAHT